MFINKTFTYLDIEKIKTYEVNQQDKISCRLGIFCAYFFLVECEEHTNCLRWQHICLHLRSLSFT